MRIRDWSSDVCSSDRARRKFLRSAKSEYAACLDVVRRLAMARPDIGFAVEHDVRRVLDVQGGQDRLARVAALTSRELAANGIGDDLDRGAVHLGGVLRLPTFTPAIADHPYFFVPARPVRARLPVATFRGAYPALLPRAIHP